MIQFWVMSLFVFWFVCICDAWGSANYSNLYNTIDFWGFVCICDAWGSANYSNIHNALICTQSRSSTRVIWIWQDYFWNSPYITSTSNQSRDSSQNYHTKFASKVMDNMARSTATLVEMIAARGKRWNRDYWAELGGSSSTCANNTYNATQ